MPNNPSSSRKQSPFELHLKVSKEGYFPFFWLALASGFWLLAFGFWLLASDFWLWLLAFGFSLLAFGFWLLASSGFFWLFASGFELLASAAFGLAARMYMLYKFLISSMSFFIFVCVSCNST